VIYAKSLGCGQSTELKDQSVIGAVLVWDEKNYEIWDVTDFENPYKVQGLGDIEDAAEHPLTFIRSKTEDQIIVLTRSRIHMYTLKVGCKQTGRLVMQFKLKSSAFCSQIVSLDNQQNEKIYLTLRNGDIHEVSINRDILTEK